MVSKYFLDWRNFFSGSTKNAIANAAAIATTGASRVSKIVWLNFFSAMKEQRSAVMAQCLDDSARVRLANIRAVKPEKAEQLENVVIGNMQRGGL